MCVYNANCSLLKLTGSTAYSSTTAYDGMKSITSHAAAMYPVCVRVIGVGGWYAYSLVILGNDVYVDCSLLKLTGSSVSDGMKSTTPCTAAMYPMCVCVNNYGGWVVCIWYT